MLDTLLARPPAWCLPLPKLQLDWDFARRRYWGGHPLDKVTWTRASTGDYVQNTNGLYVPVPDANFPRISGKGLLIEQAATNNCLYSRDWRITTALTVSSVSGTFTDGETITATGGGTGTYRLAASTGGILSLSGGSGTFTGTATGGTSGATATINAAASAWVPSNGTSALDATGADGVANSATTLTATGANATWLQGITLGSAGYTFSVLIKRVSGSGNIDITNDNGSTWTTCSGLSSTDSTRYTFESTATNPTVGVRIVTSGDVVVVDFGQLEALVTGSPTGASAFATSPIWTITTAAARAADFNLFKLPTVFNGRCGTLYVEATPSYVPSASISIFEQNAGTTSRNSLSILSTAKLNHVVTLSNVTQVNSSSTASVVAGTTYKWGASFITDDAIAAYSTQSTVLADAACSMPGTASGFSNMYIGHNNGASYCNSYIRRIAFAALPSRMIFPLTQQ